MVQKLRRSLCATLSILVVFALAAPGFLACSDPPAPSDAVVLYLGPEREARREEARRLLDEGYARYLVIPSLGEVFRVGRGGRLDRLLAPPQAPGNVFLLRKAANYGRYYENTHVETLEARRIMRDLGLRSALLVSSPYHMRRIALIAGRVFAGDGFRLGFVPARDEPRPAPADWLDPGRRGNIVSEYLKLAWFLCYAPFAPR